ncbi:MAG: hypothetical protein ACJAZ3_000569 [Sphingobacteriales bacterium]|jgi:hypothetical protein
MKKIILLGIIALTTLISNSQSIEIVESIDTVTSPEVFTGEYEGYIYVKNIGMDTMNMNVRRVYNDTANDHSAFFCWTLCYGPETNEAPTTEKCGPGDTIKLFKGYVDPDKNGDQVPQNGVTIQRFCFFDADNEADSTCRSMVFSIGQTGTSIKTLSNIEPVYLSNTYATTHLNVVNIGSIADYRVISAKGNVVQSGVLNQPNTTQTVMVNELSTGIYFFQSYSNGIKYTKKFVKE